MSYTIEFNRQFIKTKRGFIPCWLVGENNVTEGHGRYERIAREWDVFLKMIDLTEDEMIEEVKKYFNQFDQHWKRGSQYISNEGMIKWIKSGCRTAATIEEILSVNNRNIGITAKIVEYDVENNVHTKNKVTSISTNAELEKWIIEYKESCKNNKVVYPIIDFGVETIKHPKKYKDDNKEKFLLRVKNGYISIRDGDNRNIYFQNNPKDATIFTKETFDKLCNKFKRSSLYGEIYNARKVDISERNKKQYVLKIVNGYYAGRYIGRSEKKRVKLESDPMEAVIYSTESSANKAKEKYQFKLGIDKEIIVEEI